MPSRPLTPDVALNVRLHAICSRNQFTHDPGPVIEELRAAAGDRTEILLEAVGVWAGAGTVAPGAEYTVPLREAIAAAFPECAAWMEVGRERMSRPVHTSQGF